MRDDEALGMVLLQNYRAIPLQERSRSYDCDSYRQQTYSDRNLFCENLFSPYMGDGLTSIIRLRSELKASGEDMNTPMVTRLTGAGAAQGGYRGSKTAARRGPAGRPQTRVTTNWLAPSGLLPTRRRLCFAR
jgi:hypothetical protein